MIIHMPPVLSLVFTDYYHVTLCGEQINLNLVCFNRDPRYNNRPTFDELFELLNQSDSDVLSWSETDRALCTQQAMQIGAPVAEGASLYQDLQKTYQITLV